MTKSEIGEIWRWRHPSPGYPSEFKVRVNPQHGSISRQIARWKETKPGAIYTYPNKAVCRDYIIPAKYYNRTAKLIGVPRRKKHHQRVKAGSAHKSNLRHQRNLSITRVVPTKSTADSHKTESSTQTIE